MTFFRERQWMVEIVKKEFWNVSWSHVVEKKLRQHREFALRMRVICWKTNGRLVVPRITSFRNEKTFFLIERMWGKWKMIDEGI